jgi:branched-chain amino acid transport system permease protein
VNELFDILASAIPLAFQYMLVGLAWVVIFRATGVLNFAIGQYLIVGALMAHMLIDSWGVPFLAGIVAAAVVVGLAGMLSYTLLLRPIAGQAPFAQVIMTFGLSIVLAGLIPILWGDAAQRIPAPIDNSRFVELPFDAFWTTFGFATMVVGAVMVSGIILFLRKVRVGSQMEAAAERPLLASQSGININRLFSLSWGLALIPAALGGISVGLTTSVGPPLAVLGLRAIAPVIIGGLESIPGVAVGSIIVALWENAAILLFGSDSQDAAVFTLLLVVLIIRPYGIFGRAEVRRV